MPRLVAGRGCPGLPTIVTTVVGGARPKGRLRAARRPPFAATAATAATASAATASAAVAYRAGRPAGTPYRRGPRARRGRHRPPGQRRARQRRTGGQRRTRQQQPVQRLEVRARVRAEVVGERPADRLVRGERVGRAARRVQRADQLRVEGLVERVVHDELAQLRYDVRRLAEREVGVDTAVQRGEPQRLGAGGGGLPVRQIGQRGAAPQRERLPQHVGRLLCVTGAEGPRAVLRQRLEVEEVDVLLAVRGEAVAPGRGDHRVPADGPAQTAHERLERGRGVLGRVVGPHLVDEDVHGYGSGACGAHGERGEQRAETGTAQRQGVPVVVACFGRAEDQIPHGVIVLGSAVGPYEHVVNWRAVTRPGPDPRPEDKPQHHTHTRSTTRP